MVCVYSGFVSIKIRQTNMKTAVESETLALEIPRAIALRVTPKQFEAIAQVNRDLKLERTATGELIMNPPTGGESGRRNFKLIGQFARWCEENEDLGEGFDSSTGFILPNGANRSPDVSWVRRDRWYQLTEVQRQGFVPLCPDFVVELRSNSDRLPQLQGKMREYLENGASLGWLIDPQNQQVEIYRSSRDREVLNNPTYLSGETILPGFVLDLNRI